MQIIHHHLPVKAANLILLLPLKDSMVYNTEIMEVSSYGIIQMEASIFSQIKFQMFGNMKKLMRPYVNGSKYLGSLDR
jgi:hypothetical protein